MVENKKIYETDNFIVEAFATPHVTRLDGGNIRIIPKYNILDRTEMTKEQANEFIRLTMIIGKAYTIAMKNRGIELARINYQDMGNWAFKNGKEPFFHLHIYGRAKNAKYQPYKEAVYLPPRESGFYDNFEPLDDGDIAEIRAQIDNVLREDKFKQWK